MAQGPCLWHPKSSQRFDTFAAGSQQFRPLSRVTADLTNFSQSCGLGVATRPSVRGDLQAIELLIDRLAGEEESTEQLQENDVPAPFSAADAPAGQECQAAPRLACRASAGPENKQCPHSQQTKNNAESEPCVAFLAVETDPCTPSNPGASVLGQATEESVLEGGPVHEGGKEQQKACSLLGKADVVLASPDAPTKKRKPARNRECPCGSGKRYKNCCGPVQAAAARREAGQDLEECTVTHAMTALYV